ncbi:hypothetical protein PoB_003312000 [Plakobranchus ocellatus]|uniref:Uncharacterized protein n=1 Tax=Plakobranchus ocellatus TaxID=259542 RepID=A0AAV4AIK0_9GAST|nr:hypothetical protein PoB_003312000 [Plakobranchus ocellatus]
MELPQRNGESLPYSELLGILPETIQMQFIGQGVNKPRVEGRRSRSSWDRESNGRRTCGSMTEAERQARLNGSGKQKWTEEVQPVYSYVIREVASTT